MSIQWRGLMKLTKGRGLLPLPKKQSVVLVLSGTTENTENTVSFTSGGMDTKMSLNVTLYLLLSFLFTILALRSTVGDFQDGSSTWITLPSVETLLLTK